MSSQNTNHYEESKYWYEWVFNNDKYMV